MNFNLTCFSLILPLLLTSPWSRAQVNTRETDPLLAEAQLFPSVLAPGQGADLKISMKLPTGFHAYEDQFHLTILEPDGFLIGPLKASPLKKWFDKFSNKERTGFENEATLNVHIEAPSRFSERHSQMKMEFTYQACSTKFCLFPAKKKLTVPISVAMVDGEAHIAEGSITPVAPNSSFFDSANFEKNLGASLFAGLFFVFLAGIVTSFTPCIFPMIPITLAILGNHSEERSRLQNFITSVVYVLGIATTYSLLGLAAASSGLLFGATLGNPYVLTAICIIFLAMALSMYGLFETQVPAFLRNRLGSGKQKQGLFGAYLTGLFAGIVASPCVGPVLVAILTYVASTQNKFLGFLYLFFYALGLGLIFIALGLSNQLIKLLPRSGAWMNGIKFILGSLMLSAFYYYLRLLFSERWFDVALGVGLITVASVYGAFHPSRGSVFSHIRKGLMVSLLIIGIGHMLLGAFELRSCIRIVGTDSLNRTESLNWLPYSEGALAQAMNDQKPVILYFWAEWCTACRELAELTFTDERVRATADNFVLLKYDTTQDSETLRTLKKKYMIQGLPTVLFFSPQGMWIDALTLTQFEKAEDLLKRMEKVAK